jgi:hypothetical protein
MHTQFVSSVQVCLPGPTKSLCRGSLGAAVAAATSRPHHTAGWQAQFVVACRFKLEAIEGLVMGTENRINMLFSGPDKFWPAKAHILRPLEG